MNKTSSGIAMKTSGVKEEMELKWIKQPATLRRKHPTLRKKWVEMDKTTSDIAKQT